MNGINPLHTITGLTAIGQQPGGRGTALPGLETGQTLTATVLQARPQGQFLLAFGETQLLAQSQVALQVGQSLQLRLTASQPQLQFTIVADGGLQQFLGKTVALVNKNISLVSLMAMLRQPQPPLLDTLSSTSRQTLESFLGLQQQDLTGGDGGPILQRLIDRLGLNFERLLAAGKGDQAASTLKAALLEIAHHFQEAKSLSSQTNTLLSVLELYQLAQVQLDAGKYSIYPLPLPFLDTGYLLVEHDSSSEENRSSGLGGVLKFSLFLSLTELGHIRVDFVSAGNGVFLRFHTDSQEKADFAAAYADDLQQAITQVPLLGLSFTAGAHDPLTELLQKMLPEDSSLLNTRV